jgi:hypothetical protein
MCLLCTLRCTALLLPPATDHAPGGFVCREKDRERERERDRQRDAERERARFIKADVEARESDDEMEPWQRRPLRHQ